MKFTSKPSLARIERIQQVLRGRAMTYAEVAAEIHMADTSTLIYINHLRSIYCIYIEDWRRQNRYYVPLFRWGDEPDAEKPPNMTSTERARVLQEKLKADPVEHEIALARRRAKKFKPQRDWAASWIPTKAAV